MAVFTAVFRQNLFSEFPRSYFSQLGCEKPVVWPKLVADLPVFRLVTGHSKQCDQIGRNFAFDEKI
jgi:hypothetical protein